MSRIKSRPLLFLSSVSLVVFTACGGAELPTSASPADALMGKAPTVTDPTTEFTIAADPTLGLQRDSYSASYKHGVCGVNSTIFAVGALASGDAIMHPSNPKFRDAKCSAYPRKLLVNYGSVTVATSEQLLVDNLQNATTSIPIGTTQSRAMNLADARCAGLKWRTAARDGAFIGGDSVQVTRLSARSWRVFNTAGSNRARCMATGELLAISVDFIITADRDMP